MLLGKETMVLSIQKYFVPTQIKFQLDNIFSKQIGNRIQWDDLNVSYGIRIILVSVLQ